MSKQSNRILITGLTFILGVSVVTGLFYVRESQKVEIQLPNDRWEQIFFKVINKTTKLSGLYELRNTKVSGDDIEVRVWRGFGLGDLEGVILKRTNDRWRAFHVKADDYIEPQHTDVFELYPAKAGWEILWNDLVEQGLLTLRDPSEVDCEDSGLDGTSYVVEINQNNIYRTYRMREGGDCPGVRQMERITDRIGEEFDSGREQCRTAEWFACAALRKSQRGKEYKNL